MPQNGIKMSVAATCHFIACILHNPKLTPVLDHKPSACVGHDAWHSEGLPVPPADVVAKDWGDVLQFLRKPVRDSCRFCIMRQLSLSRVFRLRASATMPKRCSRNGTAVM